MLQFKKMVIIESLKTWYQNTQTNEDENMEHSEHILSRYRCAVANQHEFDK